MDPRDISKYMTELGKRGGPARAKALTAEQRKRIARKAAKASVKARREKAKKRAEG